MMTNIKLEDAPETCTEFDVVQINQWDSANQELEQVLSSISRDGIRTRHEIMASYYQWIIDEVIEKDA